MGRLGWETGQTRFEIKEVCPILLLWVKMVRVRSMSKHLFVTVVIQRINIFQQLILLQ
ncbi:hypothetical protein Hanom_Chr08g00684071 [Helianthus anomalus]